MNPKEHKPYYAIEDIKQIPILEVCQVLGIEVSRYNKCKIRDEKTASAVIHPEPDQNRFYDFGTGTGGDVISLVRTVTGCSFSAALSFLGETFGIAPTNPRAGLRADELTTLEYQRIGLDGNKASNNFTYDFARMSEDRKNFISLQYSMPMNVLKKEHPRTFERLIGQKALPYVNSLRNDYYVHVFNEFSRCKLVSPERAENLFQQNYVDNGFFEKELAELTSAERILIRACNGTRITPWEPKIYEPMEDLHKILSGEIKLGLGLHTKKEMEGLAKKFQTSVKYDTVSYSGFMNATRDLSVFHHSAFLNDGNVVMGYLESDYKDIHPVLENIRIPIKKNLSAQISSAQKQQSESKNTKSQSMTKTKDPHSR